MLHIPSNVLKLIVAGASLQGGSCPTTNPPAPPPVVTFWEWELDKGPLNVSPPSRMDILMNYSDPSQDDDLDAEAERCSSWGGELISNPTQTIYICEGVDY